MAQDAKVKIRAEPGFPCSFAARPVTYTRPPLRSTMRNFLFRPLCLALYASPALGTTNLLSQHDVRNPPGQRCSLQTCGRAQAGAKCRGPHAAGSALRLLFPRGLAEGPKFLNPSGIIILTCEKAFGVKMDTLLRMQASYDIAQTRKRAKQIHVRRIHPLAEIPA